MQDGSPSFENCRFEGNTTHLGHGGGMQIYGHSVPVIRDCTFAGNTCISGSVDATGAGLSNDAVAEIVVERCLFENNVNRRRTGRARTRSSRARCSRTASRPPSLRRSTGRAAVR